MKTVVIVNPLAGRVRRRRLAGALERLRGLVDDVVVMETELPGHATVLAREAVTRGADRVIAAGGDGTINEVANGLVETGVPLAILPLGTANVLAGEIGLPNRPDKAAECAVKGRAVSVHLGKAGPRFFLLMVGVGFDAAVVHGVRDSFKRRMGRLAYVWAGMQVLARGWPCSFRVTVDGREKQAACVVAANARRYAGRFVLAPNAGLTQPRLDLLLFHGSTRRALVRYALGILLGRHIRYPDVEYLSAQSLEIRGDGPRTVQVDGEPAGDLPLDVRIAPDVLQLVFPTR